MKKQYPKNRISGLSKKNTPIGGPGTTTIKICASCPESIAIAIDELAESKNLNRSEMCREIFETFFKKSQKNIDS